MTRHYSEWLALESHFRTSANKSRQYSHNTVKVLRDGGVCYRCREKMTNSIDYGALSAHMTDAHNWTFESPFFSKENISQSQLERSATE